MTKQLAILVFSLAWCSLPTANFSSADTKKEIKEQNVQYFIDAVPELTFKYKSCTKMGNPHCEDILNLINDLKKVKIYRSGVTSTLDKISKKRNDDEIYVKCCFSDKTESLKDKIKCLLKSECEIKSDDSQVADVSNLANAVRQREKLSRIISRSLSGIWSRCPSLEKPNKESSFLDEIGNLGSKSPSNKEFRDSIQNLCKVFFDFKEYTAPKNERDPIVLEFPKVKTKRDSCSYEVLLDDMRQVYLEGNNQNKKGRTQFISEEKEKLPEEKQEKFAKEQWKKFAKKDQKERSILSEEEQLAVFIYSGGFYRVINPLFSATKDGQAENKEQFDNLKPYLDMFFHALKKLPQEEFLVSRYDSYSLFPSSGEKFLYSGPLSTTLLSREELEGALSPHVKKEYNSKIKLRGVKIGLFSLYGEQEREVIGIPPLIFRVEEHKDEKQWKLRQKPGDRKDLESTRIISPYTPEGMFGKTNVH